MEHCLCNVFLILRETDGSIIESSKRTYSKTDSIITNGLTVYAWEHMFHKGRHIFWRNNELAGEAAATPIIPSAGIAL